MGRFNKKKRGRHCFKMGVKIGVRTCTLLQFTVKKVKEEKLMASTMDYEKNHNSFS